MLVNAILKKEMICKGFILNIIHFDLCIHFSVAPFTVVCVRMYR